MCVPGGHNWQNRMSIFDILYLTLCLESSQMYCLLNASGQLDNVMSGFICSKPDFKSRNDTQKGMPPQVGSKFACILIRPFE